MTGVYWEPERRQVYGLTGTIVAVTLRKEWW